MHFILQQLYIDQTVLYSVITGLLMLPVSFWLWCAFCWLWQESLWREYRDLFVLLESHGFALVERTIRPNWCLKKEEIRIVISWRPFEDAIWVYVDRKWQRLVNHTPEALLDAIDLLAPVESISKPQSL